MRRAVLLIAALTALVLAAPAQASDRGDLQRYASDTWASLAAMTDADSGLPADALEDDGTRSVQTSNTNIGAYMWSALVAERLGIIGRRELVARLKRTVGTLERMERHESGQYFNWYDHRTGEKLTTWPPTGARSSRSCPPSTTAGSPPGCAWSSAACRSCASAPGRSTAAWTSASTTGPEENRILFHIAPSTGEAPCCYDTIVSESRIASYIGIAKRELPAKHYFGAWRTFPDSCEHADKETRPLGFDRTYLGVDVFEGAYPYAGTRVTPVMGREHVRGADARAVRPRGALGAGQLARSTTR